MKTVFEWSAHPELLNNVQHQVVLANLKPLHKLNRQIVGHNSSDRQDRKCIRCDLNGIEDTFHIVLVSHGYISLTKLHSKYVSKSMYVF